MRVPIPPNSTPSEKGVGGTPWRVAMSITSDGALPSGASVPLDVHIDIRRRGIQYTYTEFSTFEPGDRVCVYTRVTHTNLYPNFLNKISPAFL
jgi:hypothetical protein